MKWQFQIKGMCPSTNTGKCVIFSFVVSQAKVAIKHSQRPGIITKVICAALAWFETFLRFVGWLEIL